MDKYVMYIRLENWISIFAVQARSGLNKQASCYQNGIRKDLLFKCRGSSGKKSKKD